MGKTSLTNARRWLLPTLVATALALAGCGDTPAGGPGGATTLPDTSASTSTPPTTTSTTSISTPSSPTTTSAPAPTSTNVAPGTATPAEAIGVWMDGKGYVYAGDCATTTIEDDIGKYCSSLCKAGADKQVYKTGPTFAEYTTWLLLKKSGDTWSVVDTAPDTGTAPAPW